jgi:hypothetical protein
MNSIFHCREKALECSSSKARTIVELASQRVTNSRGATETQCTDNTPDEHTQQETLEQDPTNLEMGTVHSEITLGAVQEGPHIINPLAKIWTLKLLGFTSLHGS